MAYLSRVVGLLLLVFAGSAFSSSSDYYFYGSSPWFSSAEAGCASVAPPTPNHVFSHVYIPPGYGDAYWQCFFADTTIPPPNTAQNGGGMKGTCPVGKIADYAAKVCIDAPPEPDPCPEAGTKEGDSSNAYTTNSRVPANNLCIGSCSWSAGGVVPSVCANGKCYYYGPFTSNGTSCTGDGGGPVPPEPEPAPPDDASCVSKGQCPGTINGTKVCVPCSSKEGTTTESGSTSGSGTDSSGNPTGETGTTNTTKETTANCTNGSCNTTTTTTVTNPDGSTTTTTETESTPQADFCKSNPGHVVCKGEDESTFGGDCSSGFQGTGDAVQVATARAVWESRCALNEGPDQASQDTMDALKTWSMSDLNLPDLTVTAPMPEAATCPLGDISANFGQFTVPLPLSMLCPYLAVIHKVVTSFGMLMWLLIVFVRGK